MTKKILTLMAATALAGTVPTAVSAQQIPGAVVAVFDQTRIYSECTACVAANTQIQAQATALQTRAQTLQAPLQTEAAAIQQAIEAAGGTPDAALQARIQTFQTNQQNAQTEVAAQQQTIQRNAAFVRQQISQALEPIISQIMTQRGANIAMAQGATLAATSTLNVTDAALAALNTALPTVSTTAPPPPTPPTATEGR